MSGMFTSEAVTRGIRVSVVAEYAPGRSRPFDKEWFFLYTITIANEGDETVQLISRHWIITNAAGMVEEVRGAGVVGEQPVLEPSQSFTYTSGCPLGTAFGTMEGTYQMVTRSGEHFDARIAPFTLSEPYTVH
ncbi:MAG TPA: Co2+/Mg2+ efflux protein ApaG [Vicinamibacterales bacterium]|jgi:ApaG protein|nr:Co2+/Mg2+ efflux protein ApaG [Vicinamibacterales bacterium]